MRAISMMQPFAWLFANGRMTIDDRRTGTPYRGPVIIHASKNFLDSFHELLTKLPAAQHWQMPKARDEFERGGIVGIANLVDVIKPVAPGSMPPDLRRSHFGGHGLTGLVFSEPKSFPLVPYPGKVGFFDVPSELVPPDILASCVRPRAAR